MSKQKITENSPSGIGNLRVGIITHDSEFFDISDNIIEISFYESIYYAFIHGSMSVLDNSMMLADLPFAGQERAVIQWMRDDRLLSKVFYINKVSNVAKQNDGAGVFELTLNSLVQVRNAVNLFSQSYRGRSDEIIERVMIDHLDASPVRQDDLRGKTSHNVVFPFMKPLQAVDMIRKNVLSDDDTPMFLYDTFYSNELRLDSFGRMMSRRPITTIESKKPANRDPDAQASRQSLRDRGMTYDESISRAYNTFDDLNKGAFGSTVTVVDPSIREYDYIDFDYKKHAPSYSQDWISPSYDVEGNAVNEIKSTRNLYLSRNALAFNDDFPNLNTIENLDRSILSSYVLRHATTVVKVYMDSIAYTLENNDPFVVGQTVTYNMLKYMPKLSASDEELDLFNSGKYIISAIRHFIKNGEYNMSIELIRDGIGNRAEWERRS